MIKKQALLFRQRVMPMPLRNNPTSDHVYSNLNLFSAFLKCKAKTESYRVSCETKTGGTMKDLSICVINVH